MIWLFRRPTKCVRWHDVVSFQRFSLLHVVLVVMCRYSYGVEHVLCTHAVRTTHCRFEGFGFIHDNPILIVRLVKILDNLVLISQRLYCTISRYLRSRGTRAPALWRPLPLRWLQSSDTKLWSQMRYFISVYIYSPTSRLCLDNIMIGL